MTFYEALSLDVAFAAANPLAAAPPPPFGMDDSGDDDDDDGDVTVPSSLCCRPFVLV